MKKIINYSLIALCAVAISATSCESSHEKSEALTILESKFKATNTDFVEKTVKPTYRALADNDKKLVEQLSALKTDADVQKACDLWKVARQDWEWSEAFLFGPAGDYGIDPHTDTWPFDRTQFDKYMAKFHPATDESDAAIIDDAIANGQNLTGFHAVEYLIFRDGNARKLADMTADEIYFAKGAAQDLRDVLVKMEKARALLKDAAVYIFDEATSNKDIESEELIMNVIHELAKTKTVLLISHRLANVVKSDKIYFLKDGEIKESGKHDELMSQNGAYGHLYESQMALENYGKKVAV